MTNPRVGFVSLGCPKALVDSERILTQLRSDGYEISPTYARADVVIVNTCGFIDSARAESLDAIGEAINKNGRVIVTGCMGGDGNTIRELHPAVLAVSGPQQYAQVVSAVHQHAPIRKYPEAELYPVPAPGVKLTPKHYAYLKISEGCNHKCTFCIIPSMRGPLVSRSVGDVLTEAQQLVEAGVRELLVISQDTSAYGVDLKYRLDCWDGRPLKTRITEMCRALGSLGAWIRLHYVYPYPHVDELIPLMADGLILPYLDIPLQHGSPRILKLMKRPAATENALLRIKKWREICPEITLRSTFIVGFPGETDADFQQLLAFIAEAQLDRVGCFKYSAVTGARANDLPHRVPANIMVERERALMELQARISQQRLQHKIGSLQQVLVDHVDTKGATARSRGDAPEIDGLVHITDGQQLQSGALVNVRIETADAYDLSGCLAR